MNKEKILEKYNKDEDKLLAAKILDKINFVKTKNKIEYTDFLDMYQKKICENILNVCKGKNYIFYEPFEEAQKNILILYPQKLESIFINNQFDFNKIIKVIKITLPNELKGKYTHKDYLSGVMKLGIKREKFGDILVNNNGALIIANVDLADYIKENLQQLTRFSKSKIEIVNINEIQLPQIRKEEKRIIVSAMRMDNIIAELANTSRNGANEIIDSKRVFVNYENESRKSRIINENDIIVIRGKGKFKILKINGETKKGRIVVNITHYI